MSWLAPVVWLKTKSLLTGTVHHLIYPQPLTRRILHALHRNCAQEWDSPKESGIRVWHSIFHSTLQKNSTKVSNWILYSISRCDVYESKRRPLPVWRDNSICFQYCWACSLETSTAVSQQWKKKQKPKTKKNKNRIRHSIPSLSRKLHSKSEAKKNILHTRWLAFASS